MRWAAPATRVLQGAADAGKLGIGGNSNQTDLHPGRVLTSTARRVDVATRTAFEAACAGRSRRA